MCPKINSRRILVVGAGLSGAVVARELADNGYQVTVIDKRNHIAGNVFDYVNEHGIRIHKYGPHFFHTKNQNVFEWLSRFTEWIPYKHKVKAILDDGRLVTLPVNKETKEVVGANNIVEIFIRPYTEKMWGMKLEQVSPNTIKRVPIRDDDNEFYFPDDLYQYVPKDGYTKLVENIFNHGNISIELGKSFSKQMEEEFDHVFNSMPIDEYYDFQHGRLEYRSIKFHHTNLPSPKVFPVSQINFTNYGQYTRIVEWKNIPGHGVNNLWTSLTYEEPCHYSENNDERYYPVRDISGELSTIYRKYFTIENSKVTFIGRLGNYAYLDMDQCVNISIKLIENFIRFNISS
jgi:UDP-galactopyranose mutase